jgi:hypothetical protein
MATSPNFGWLEPDNTDLVKNGALAIRTLGDAIDASLVDLKGGTTGQVLAKASNTDMDFVWAADAGAPESLGFTAGKNKIINGDFSINQRNATSFNAISTFTYLFDRWATLANDGTTTCSVQAFTAGTAPVAGYEGTNFARYVTSGQTSTSAYSLFIQRMEDVRTYANQTVTVSFWAKAASGTPKIATELAQNFGSGGSSVVQTYAGQSTLTTSWARYSVTVAVPSISGKTLGAGSNLELTFWVSSGSDFNARNGSLGIQSNTFDIWGVQVEAGSVATAFQTATGTIQGELAACQRYYWRQSASGVNNYFTAGGLVESSTSGWATLIAPVTMRVTPTSVDYSGLILSDSAGGGYAPSAVTIFANGSGTNTVRVSTTISGATGGRWAYLRANTTNDYIGLSAEL